MQKVILILLGLLGVTFAQISHSQNFAQVGAEQFTDVFLQSDTYLDTAMCGRRQQNLNVTDCLKYIRENLLDNTTYHVFNWRFKGQVDCWIKYAEEFGYEYFEDMPADPFANTHFAFTMPNTRHYEHFYNDEGCNQVWRMGRGRVQPDAITFYDIHVHEYNTLLSLNRYQITPWVTHDQMVLQFFGVTEQCVELYTDVESMGRGLVMGQFRIEYYNTTGLTYIDGSDLGRIEADAPYTTPVVTGLDEMDICICRTKHYLQICQIEYCKGCSFGCEYFPAFTSNDRSLAPFSHYGNYTVPCGPNDVLTFNGTSYDGNYEHIETKAFNFADKCESDNFIMTGGQHIHIRGNLTGHLEVLIDDVNFATSPPTGILEPFLFFYDRDGELYDQHSVNTIIAVAPFNALPAFYNQVRFWVYAKHNTWDLCRETCELQPVPMCLSSTPPTLTALNDVAYFGAGVDANLMGVAGNDYINTGLGDDLITEGGDGDDIIEDHKGRDTIKGNAGSDILISRSGGDILYGGGPYQTIPCVNDDTTMDSASMTCTAFYDTPANQPMCGTLDDDDFVAAELCCGCGGGTDGAAVVVPGEDDPSDDCNTYVIYPTSEKDHHFDWTPTNTKDAATFTCTKICGMTLQDTIEFRLDDPTFEDYKYTDADDNCSLRVDGWEIQWYMGAGLVSDDGATGFVPGEGIIDVWFSRETGMAHICLNREPGGAVARCSGGPDGEVSNDYCLAYWVQCLDQDPWPDTDLDDYITNLEILNWYGYW